MASASTLEEQLRALTREADPALIHRQPDGKIRCLACGHRCLVGPGRSGVCRVRYNEEGHLRVPSGYVAAIAVDPVEKKPFFHCLPGAEALSFGMLGCDLHCAYCQNWLTSQALRDPAAVAPIRPMSAEQVVQAALAHHAPLVVSTYNEPLITSEWAVEVFTLARTEGLKCAYVSNGNATPEVLDYLAPHLAAYKVDLKSFDDANYRRLGGILDNVLETIEGVYARGIWLEVVTLVVPDFNDSADELHSMAKFLARISPDIPWHVTTFHADYNMNDRDSTPRQTLQLAARIGREEGLHHVYAGNLHPGDNGLEDTHCAACQTTLIRRRGFRVIENLVPANGLCPTCHTPQPGIWV